MPFHQLEASLTAQFPQDHADLSPQPLGEDFPAVFRYNHNMDRGSAKTYPDRGSPSCNKRKQMTQAARVFQAS